MRLSFRWYHVISLTDAHKSVLSENRNSGNSIPRIKHHRKNMRARSTAIMQDIQKTHRVTIVGPTTLAAFVYSLQVGFKTLAISKQSSEVWRLLGAIKTEFGKFGDAVSSVQKNLETASSNLTKVSTRARQMEKKLDGVQALPLDEALKLLPVGSEKSENGDNQA